MAHNSRFLSNHDHLCRIPIIDHQISNQTKDQFNVQIRAQINNRTRDQFNARIKDHNNHSVLEMVNIMEAANMVTVNMVEVNQWVVKADSLIIQRVITIIKILEPNPLVTKLMTNSFQPLPIHILLRFLVSMI